jgi:hypothetical protein
VTTRKVSINLNLVSISGVSSKKLITTCTIFVIACLSCPCFFESTRTCSSSRFQSPASLQIVTIATSARDVEARSDDYLRHLDRRHVVRLEMYSFTCLACFSNTNILSMPLWISVCRKCQSNGWVRGSTMLTFAISCASGMILSASLVKSLSGLRMVPSDMSGRVLDVRGMKRAKRYQSSVADSSELDELFVNHFLLINATKSCT